MRNARHFIAMNENKSAEKTMAPVNVCDVVTEKLSDRSSVWNVAFQRVAVGCRSEQEAIVLNRAIKDLIANCSAWVQI